jgi:hypothetical protein
MRRFREAAAAACTVASIGVALAWTPAAGAEVRLHDVGPRFDAPIHVAGAPGDGERLYVAEKGGLVKVVRGGTASEFADLSTVVRDDGEEGLLSIAFPPDFQTSRLFYAYYTDLAGDNRVDELRAPTGDAADPGSRRTVLTIPHPGAGNHNGGQLQFGRDGMLYLAPGDGADRDNARDLASPLGKVLRLDPRGGVAGSYTVPADNPYASAGGFRALVWSYGLRNPFRFSFDRLTGDLVLGDVGEGTTEEINWVPAAGGAGKGADFGWGECEGSFDTGSRTTPCPLRSSVLPILDKFQDPDGWASIVPGYVVRDPSLPALYGRLVYGDYFQSALHSAVPAAPRATDDRALPGVEVANLTSFGEDAGGCVYVTLRGEGVYRLVENDTRVPCAPAAPPGDGGGDQPPIGDGGRRDGGGGGGGGGGGTGGDTPGGPATTPVPLRLGWKPAQRALRNGGVVVQARCARACRLTAGGTVQAGRRKLALRKASRRARAHQRVRLVVKLTPRARTELRRQLARRRLPLVTVGVRARHDGSRASTLRRAAIRVRR